MPIDIVLSWFAVASLSISYWFQIFKIIRLKEVRDISLPYHILLAVGFAILTYTAYNEGSVVFLAKQILTTIPVLIIIGQVLYYGRKPWNDLKLAKCTKCQTMMHREWKYCAGCGSLVQLKHS